MEYQRHFSVMSEELHVQYPKSLYATIVLPQRTRFICHNFFDDVISSMIFQALSEFFNYLQLLLCEY